MVLSSSPPQAMIATPPPASGRYSGSVFRSVPSGGGKETRRVSAAASLMIGFLQKYVEGVRGQFNPLEAQGHRIPPQVRKDAALDRHVQKVDGIARGENEPTGVTMHLAFGFQVRHHHFHSTLPLTAGH